MYVLDADVIIRANQEYYPIDRFPEFWDWLAHHAREDRIKMPREIYNELTPTDSNLKAWLKDNRKAILLNDDTHLEHVSDILDLYAPDLTEAELEQIGQDPFLIASAKANGGVVVTKEKSRRGRVRGNRHIPDVCRDAGVRCIDDHMLIRELDFRTSWRVETGSAAER